MAYLLVTLNHFRVVQSWAQGVGAKVNLDVASFELEIQAKNRVYKLYPQFFAVLAGGGFSHSPLLTDQAEGFIGWLPYKPLSWDLASEKLTFKRFIEQSGELTPRSEVNPVAMSSDYLFKRSRGSFGYELSGPYSANVDPASVIDAAAASGRHADSTLFAEQFIEGNNLKVWFWGTTAIYAHLHPYPTVEGDGLSSVESLIQKRLASVQVDFDDSPDMVTTRSALQYQKVALNDVLPSGSSIWIDYRYGRRYARDPKLAVEDNALPRLPLAVQQQIGRIGHKLGEEMIKRLSAPVLYSLDAVIDGDGKVWWLEMNSNPVMPPLGYPVMLQDLFGVAIPEVFRPPLVNTNVQTPAKQALKGAPASVALQP